MELLECDFRSGENKYCLLKSPEGFTSFQIHEDYGKIFWIRDDLYRENYHNVIEPLIHYPGDRRFLRISDLRMRRESDLESFLLTN